MRDATHVVNKNPPIINAPDRNNCQSGTPNGTRTIIATGAVNGIIDSQKAKELSGLLIKNANDNIYVNSRGKVIGNINCCVSVSLSTAEPTAANKALYSR